ncbi:MAG: hypothetical protein IBX72_01635 [Nitrospirae bacterium]|nr:hypothetical protein [Nitrospirota bacterium]
MRKKISELDKAREPYHIAALVHIYMGTLTLEEIAACAGLSLEMLQSLRANAKFMRLVDTFKREFTGYFREDLLINDRNSEEYDSVASDYSMIEEVGRMQIRVPLFTKLRNLAESIKSKSIYNLKTDKYDLMLFKRLFLFFIFTEKYIQTRSADSLSVMKQIAEEIVWPALDLDMKEIDRILNEPFEIKEKRLKDLRKSLDEIF